MLGDAYGNQVSTSDPAIIRTIDAFTGQLLQIGKRTADVIKEALRHPDCLLVQIYAAATCLYGQTQESSLKAKEILDRALPFLANANEREKSLFQCVKHWQENQMARALECFERHCASWPRDLAALKITEFIYYCKGQKFESKRFLRTTSNNLDLNSEDPFFLSIYSFALELNDRFEEAKITAETALSKQPKNPWAHHTLTHVYLNTGKIDEGIRVIENYSPSWKEFHHVIESHNLWHLALLYLENLNFAKVQEVYRRAGWARQAKLVGEEIDAAALLWRLDMEDQDSDLLWKSIAEEIDGHGDFGATAFNSAQLCYALKRGEKEDALEQTLAQLRKFAGQLVGEDKSVWEQVGLPVIYGSLAFADRDYAKALRYYEPVIDKIGCIGGSDAQIDLFRQTFLKSLIGAKRFAEARAFFHQLLNQKNPSPLEQKWLSQCSLLRS